MCKRIIELPVKTINEYTLTYKETELLNTQQNKYKEILLDTIKEKDTSYFQLEVEKLHKWADDKILASEKELRDIKSKIKELNRESKKNITSESLLTTQTKLRDLERKKKRLRREIFQVEDEIEERRDEMINAIKVKMLKAINESSIFTIKWQLV